MASFGTSERLQRLQNEILEAIARGESLDKVAGLLCRRAEILAPTAICSILTVDADGVLHTLAGPSLPEHYSRAIDGIRIGPDVGSCGRSAFTGEAVETVDIANDPYWARYRHLALPLNLAACWSSPIKAADGRVIGTFAFYYRTCRGPAELERRIVETCVYLCAIAIENDEAKSRIRQLAYFDTLTGLPNRLEFHRLAGAMLTGAEEGRTVSVLYVDLDDFKNVNDSLGHRVGDQLLGVVAGRLSSCMRHGAVLARLGGDEFAVAQSASNGRGDACAIAERIVGMLDNPFVIDEHVVTIGASVGIAHAEPGGADLDELCRRADMALYSAKKDGGGVYRFFAPELDETARRRHEIKHDLRAAIAAGQLALVYQPIVNLASGAIVALEALLRWHHPERGMVLPDEFVPVAEEMGLIGEIGRWALGEACETATGWPHAQRVAVNLSALQLRQPSLALDLLAVLSRSGLGADRLDLEFTENALLGEGASARYALGELKKLGVGLALDNLGAGYSSLRALRSFRADRIKIARTFVVEIGANAGSMAVIRAVIGLARELGIRTVAEGVENQAQAEWLLRQGCDEAQGPHVGAPVAAAATRALLETPRPRAAGARERPALT